ncbi:hypothetical protein H310_06851 [Aphanomyces invadans]|uniref:Uncharacterized protein n=1 Tax=Aphanomyces invadans TaxID=157072 RepID=A0A024U4E3_9STRA|nr:hypothetical protein H310_06851 [Aphanomyces invadans]ETW01281.1 hypothetical protein H310_06851 [Aphanomyces invadans]|eukprot:XP_008870279.1 hypothetical protein H310_06851 [Aphanomyces invadans]
MGWAYDANKTLVMRKGSDSQALARRLHAAHPTALNVMLRIVVEGDMVSFVAIQSMLHWSYCQDACKTMVAMGVIETLLSMLPMAAPCFKFCSVDLLVRLVEHDRSALPRLLRPRLVRALLQLLQDKSNSKRTLHGLLHVLEVVITHPKANVLLKTRWWLRICRRLTHPP